MCGVIGIHAKRPVADLLYDGLLLLQHRGQDAAGIITERSARLYIQKGQGLVRDVFTESTMLQLPGQIGLAHCRYPTAGSFSDVNEAQPFYVNSPFGIALGHNGNLTNHRLLANALLHQNLRHINTGSDSEVLLNVFADELFRETQKRGADFALGNISIDPEEVFNAVRGVFGRCHGAYSIVAIIAGAGIVGFRDPHGIRPLSWGQREGSAGLETVIASESVAVEGLGFSLRGEVPAGGVIFIDTEGQVHQRTLKTNVLPTPCIFEYVYFARPDSAIEKVSIYQARINMGQMLANQVRRLEVADKIDVVMPIPDSGRPSAMALADALGKPFREGFIKNRYIGRTFIMPGQQTRKKSVRHKLNVLRQEFEGKRVALVDDSIVRGTTSQEIIQMAREAGAKEVYFCSASPPVRHQNVYGIDMPTRSELIAHGRKAPEIAALLGCDRVIYQELPELIAAIQKENSALTQFETSCFDGNYVTGISEEYLQLLEQSKRG